MDFFQQQEVAKRNSRRLFFLFILALAILVVLVNAGVFSLWIFYHSLYSEPADALWHYITTPEAAFTSLATLLVFSAGTVHRLWQMRDGGIRLIELFDATEITDTPSLPPPYKQLINIVEEMAVAASMPVPRVFVMESEHAINAFVTGKPSQYLLVVTAGAVNSFNRDEMQAVVGHEFSHLLHNDVGINLRMVAILAGLVAVSRLGRSMVRSAFYEPRRSRDIGHNNSGFAAITMFVFLGIVLWLAGYAGLLLGRLIKAAISRQRELLADASSVQFTRNPNALAEALIKIKHGAGSLLTNQYAEDISHMCFADSVPILFKGLFSTHPDIDTRLRQLGNGWVARARVRRNKQFKEAQKTAEKAPINTQSLGYAREILESIPAPIHYILSQPQSTVLLLYAIILAASDSKKLPKKLSYEEVGELNRLTEQAKGFNPRWLIPIIDLALPTLQRLDKKQHQHFIKQIDELIKADGKVTVFEYLLRQMVWLRLNPRPAVEPHYSSLHQVANSLQRLFSTLIHISASQPQNQSELFEKHAQALLPPGRVLLEKKRCTLPALASALDDMRYLTPMLRRMIIDKCADIVLEDKIIKVEELEMLRLIGLLIDSPMPSLQTH